MEEVKSKTKNIKKIKTSINFNFDQIHHNNNSLDNNMDTSRTKVESTNNSFTSSKLKNFLEALREVKVKDKEIIGLNKKSSTEDLETHLNKRTRVNQKNFSPLDSKKNEIYIMGLPPGNSVSPVVNITTEYDRNVSEYSQANANLSMEERAHYLEKPLQKNMEIINNNIMRKRSNYNYSSMNANCPYKMDFMKLLVKNSDRIVELSDEEKDGNSPKYRQKVKNNRGFSSYDTNNMKTTQRRSKNRSTTFTTDSLQAESPHIKKVKPFELIHSENLPKKLNTLDDLDELKEINLQEYKGNKNISELDINSMNLDFHYDHQKNNSKILIIDSVSQLSHSDIKKENSKNWNEESNISKQINSINIENMTEMSAGRDQGEMRRTRMKDSDFKKNEGSPNLKIFSNSINIQNIYNINLNSSKINSTGKKIRRKYLKSEIFESNSREEQVIYHYKEENVPFNRTNEIKSTHNLNQTISKNLLFNFNKTQTKEEKEPTSACVEFGEHSMEVEEIDLKINFENTHSDSNNIRKVKPLLPTTERKRTNHKSFKNNLSHKSADFSQISDFFEYNTQNNENNEYVTPEKKVRQYNTIAELSCYQDKHDLYDDSLQLADSVISEDSNYCTVFDVDFVNNLLLRENYYKADENYLQKHPKLDWSHRMILIDWLMEICEEYAFKRDTLYYTVNYIDRYLSLQHHVQKHSLQLIGMTALSIAAKFEEIQIPKIEDYLNSTDNTYSHSDFTAMERRMLKILKWEIIPTTINTWMNWHLCQWDLYIDSFEDQRRKILERNLQICTFRKPDEESYVYYRKVTQLVDLYTIDYSSLVYNSRYLVAASIFLVLCEFYKIESFRNHNLNKFDFDFKFYADFWEYDKNFLTDIYSDYLNQSFNISRSEKQFLHALVYCTRFLTFDFNANMPLVMQGSESLSNGNYEDFLSYQTHHENSYNFVEGLYRQNKIL